MQMQRQRRAKRQHKAKRQQSQDVPKLNCNGLRVVLSGAVPERDLWSSPSDGYSILESVAVLANLVLGGGGEIVHGCHPTFTPILKQAALSQLPSNSNRLHLVSSEYFPTYSSQLALGAYPIPHITRTPRMMSWSTGMPSRGGSLSSMRVRLVNGGNVFVALGGKYHKDDGIVPGVREELELAKGRGMPCFLIGAFGGVTAELASGNSERAMGNLMTDEENALLSHATDPTTVIGVLLTHLHNFRSNYLERELTELEEPDQTDYYQEGLTQGPEA